MALNKMEAELHSLQLQIHETPIVLLREEIAFTRAYCNILRHKYRNGIHYIWNCDPAELGTPVLRLPMQFLIENAVCHGLPLVVVKVLCVFRACSKQNFFY